MAIENKNIILNRASDYIATVDWQGQDISGWTIRFIVKAKNDAGVDDPRVMDIPLEAHPTDPTDQVLFIPRSLIWTLENRTHYWSIVHFYGDNLQKVLDTGIIKTAGFAV